MWPDNPPLKIIQNECPLSNFTTPLKKILPDVEPSYILPACVALDRNHNVDYNDCSSIVARNLRSHSHMLAWICAAILMIGIFVFRIVFDLMPVTKNQLTENRKTYESVIYSMCSKLTYFHSQYVKMYQKAEEREFKRLIEEKDSVKVSVSCTLKSGMN